MKKTIASFVTAAAVMTGVGVTAAAPAEAAGRDCVTRGEFRHVHHGDSRARVSRVFGYRGFPSGAGDGWRYYSKCHINRVTASVVFAHGRVTDKIWNTPFS
jgi:hypothetical protein